MLDINFVRKNQELVTKSAQEKGYKVDIERLLELDDRRRALLQQVDELRRQRNEISAKLSKGKPEPDTLAEAKRIKSELSQIEPELDDVEKNLKGMLKQLPNIIFEDVPLGGEEDSVEIKTWGDKKVEEIGRAHV